MKPYQVCEQRLSVLDLADINRLSSSSLAPSLSEWPS